MCFGLTPLGLCVTSVLPKWGCTSFLGFKQYPYIYLFRKRKDKIFSTKYWEFLASLRKDALIFGKIDYSPIPHMTAV